MSNTSRFRHVRYAWDDADAARLDPVERLIYRSNLLGSDQRITNTGGGNTSAKLSEQDPLSGAAVEVLWVKGSGGDLRTARREHFASLYLDKLRGLQERYLSAPERGPKTPIEDAMVALYPHCTFNLNPRAASIDTPLHAFVPYRHVDHTHPNAVIAVAAAKHGERLTREIYGDEVIWLPWQRPGFDLGLRLQQICREHPHARGVVLGSHGLICWADDDKACYETTLDLIERAARYIEARDRGEQTFGGQRYPIPPEAQRRALLAELLPWLRGQLSRERRFIATIQDDPATLRFVNSVDAPRLAALGTSCPDHFLRTKIKPLYVAWDPAREDSATLQQRLAAGLEQYRRDYQDYYTRHRHPDSPPMRDPNPTVILIPGLGMITWGKDKSESRVTAEFYTCAIEVMRGAEAIDEYTALPLQEAFDIEYWQLEEAKLRRMPPEKELARRIIAVVGSGSGIGRVLAQRLADEGAHVVCVDRDGAAAQATAAAITQRHGLGIGVAGSDISACGPAVALEADITDRAAIRAMLHQTLLAYGGLDAVAITAGIFVAPDAEGRIPDERWAQTFAVNVTGPYLVADEAAPLWRAQGLPASLVITTSVNAVVAKRGSLAYDASKAAANHLVRELAIELAPLVRVNGVAPATVVQGSAMFPRERVIASLTKYGLPFSADETTAALTAKLAQFYADRTLLKRAITPEDQAEAIFLLLSERLSQTTGQILTVDGGLVEAFLR
ncbi:bifunctional rhamnulose-1-phosphate aldolase/short-chain dehydrogenase [Kallotenue papyrolyticum]|uniref:bifunctional rhamnulose-1-phosphate aldolase/short-chain dehydrogenase n=1 Tax=Kallotenue papyrolyticum TaxID=1325125 RepID=UPI0004785D88|nr:bifunctional rhamnulose-1-phosphate aldolase/short-chain dehydrogenase [Kallotenue papyrolyticum]